MDPTERFPPLTADQALALKLEWLEVRLQEIQSELKALRIRIQLASAVPADPPSGSTEPSGSPSAPSTEPGG